MRVLLDTHVLLWWVADHPRLSSTHRELIGDPANDVLVSAISHAEIAIKVSNGKLQLPGDLTPIAQQSGFEALPFTAAHADALGRLPWHHRDPFDRMLIAQAAIEGVPILSVDAHMREYEIAVL